MPLAPSTLFPSDVSASDAFCRVHWATLHQWACRRGCDPHTAQDVVQDLFHSLLRRGVLNSLLEQSAAAQSAFLSMRLRCLLINRWRDANRQRRGGQLLTISLEDEGVPEPSHHETPAIHYDNAWLGNCIEKAFSRLRSQTPIPIWQDIQPSLLENTASPQTGSQRAALYRVRRKLRHLVREEMNGSFQDWSSQLPSLRQVG